LTGSLPHDNIKTISKITPRQKLLPLPPLEIRSSYLASRTAPVFSLANLCLKRSKKPHCFLFAICCYLHVSQYSALLSYRVLIA